MVSLNTIFTEFKCPKEAALEDDPFIGILSTGMPFLGELNERMVSFIFDLFKGNTQEVCEKTKEALHEIQNSLKEQKNIEILDIVLSPEKSELPQLEDNHFSAFVLFLWELKMAKEPLKDLLETCGIFGDPQTVDTILQFGHTIATSLREKNSSFLTQIESFITSLEKAGELRDTYLQFIEQAMATIECGKSSGEMVKKELKARPAVDTNQMEENVLFSLNCYLLQKPQPPHQHDAPKQGPVSTRERIAKLIKLFENPKKLDSDFRLLIQDISDPEQYEKALNAFPFPGKEYKKEGLPKNPLLRACVDSAWIAIPILKKLPITKVPKEGAKLSHHIAQVNIMRKSPAESLFSQGTTAFVASVFFHAMKEPDGTKAVATALRQFNKIWGMGQEAADIGKALLEKAKVLPVPKEQTLATSTK